MTYHKERHDIGFKYNGADTMGLMLVKDKNGKPLYRRFDDEPLSEQRASGTPGYGWFPPGKELPLILDDFSGGLSKEIYDPLNPTKYFKTVNMDCRFGQPIAGLKAVTATKPSSAALTVQNAGFEGWNNGACNNWTVSVGSITKEEGGSVIAGSVSLRLNSSSTIYQDLATSQIKGRRFILSAACNTGSISRVRIGVDDGVSLQYGAYNSVTGASTITATITLSTSATQFQLTLDTAGSLAFVDTVTVTRATLGITSSHAHYGADEYLNFGGLLAKIQSSDGTIEGVYEFPAPISDMRTGIDGTLYIAQEATGTTIEDCEDAWDEDVDGDVTSTLDTGDYKVGSGSAKFVLASGLSIGDVIATETIALDRNDWGSYDGISLRIKCSKAVSAAEIRLLLGETGPVTTGNAAETLDIPALSANEWTKVYIDLTSNDNTQTIISVGLENNVDIGPCTIWVDQIQGEYRYYNIGTSGNPTKAGVGDFDEDGYAQHFELVGSTMWKCLLPNLLYSSTNPADATTWTTSTAVGIGEETIQELVVREGTLYIMKTDRPYYLDGSNNVQVLVDDTIKIATSDSGKNATVWHSYLFMPWGTGSLLRYDGTSTEWIEPALYSVNLGDFDGQIKGLEGDEQWFYIAVDNSLTYESQIASVQGRALYGAYWESQTFTPSATHSVNKVEIPLYRIGSPGTVTVSIRATDGSGHPTGSDLTSGTLNGDALTVNTKGEWKTIALTSYSLSASTKYALVVRATSGDSDNKIAWREQSSDVYTGGNREYSDDSSSSWSASTNIDYAFKEEEGKVEVLAGRQDPSGWIWHGSLAQLSLTGCEHAFVSNSYEKRLYVSSADSTEALTYYKLYANYGDVTNDDNRNFVDDGELYTPKLHGGFKGDIKAFIKITAELGHTYDTDIYFECYYRIQGDTGWTDAGDFKGTSSSRTATLYIPDDSSGNHPSSEWIKFKLIEKTDTATKTPVLVSLDVRAILYVSKRRLIECVVRGSDKPLNKQGMPDDILGSTIAANLITADDATWPVEFYNPFNTTKYVKFISAQEIYGTHEQNRTQERQWILLLQEVTIP